MIKEQKPIFRLGVVPHPATMSILFCFSINKLPVRKLNVINLVLLEKIIKLSRKEAKQKLAKSYHLM